MKTAIMDCKNNIIAELDIEPDCYYRFQVDTLWGVKEYELKPTYHFVPEKHSKDFSKPSGMLLTKA